jgi:hypothetical protein
MEKGFAGCGLLLLSLSALLLELVKTVVEDSHEQTLNTFY